MTTPSELTARIRGEVLSRIEERRRVDEAAQRSPAAPAAEEALGRQLIAEALDGHARASLAEGRPVLSVDEEDDIARTVFDGLFRLHRLQRLLDDPMLENVNANGFDNVWVRYADGRREQVEPIANSDAELIDLLRMAAARLGIGERRFDLGSPRLTLQLPDGSRLFAVMAVAARPCLSIRCHRYMKVTPDDLVAMGTLDVALREFLGAVMRARKSCVICGGTASGKTTLLRAMAADIPAWERLITIEDSLELAWTDTTICTLTSSRLKRGSRMSKVKVRSPLRIWCAGRCVCRRIESSSASREGKKSSPSSTRCRKALMAR